MAAMLSPSAIGGEITFEIVEDDDEVFELRSVVVDVEYVDENCGFVVEFIGGGANLDLVTFFRRFVIQLDSRLQRRRVHCRVQFERLHIRTWDGDGW